MDITRVTRPTPPIKPNPHDDDAFSPLYYSLILSVGWIFLAVKKLSLIRIAYILFFLSVLVLMRHDRFPLLVSFCFLSFFAFPCLDAASRATSVIAFRITAAAAAVAFGILLTGISIWDLSFLIFLCLFMAEHNSPLFPSSLAFPSCTLDRASYLG
ncbi:hypothetical protein V8F33_003804 [Rhypophila sp. PSN 637]